MDRDKKKKDLKITLQWTLDSIPWDNKKPKKLKSDTIHAAMFSCFVG